jgi:PAS domain S-box-containing protein
MHDATPPPPRVERHDVTLRRYLRILGDIALAGEVPLEDLLQRIVDAARTLLHARYAALGTFDSQGTVTRFITSGITSEERADIGPLPKGAGLLGLIVRERRVIRTPRIRDHAASVGFPAHHPPMTSFLGGPIARGDVVYGNLYLADRLDATEFSEDHEEILTMFAGHAALAIENARRFERARREERTIRALFEIGRALARLTDPNAVLELVVREARQLLQADVAALCLRHQEENTLRWTVVQGSIGRFEAPAPEPLGSTLAGQVLQRGVPLQTQDVQTLDTAWQSNPLIVEAQLRSVLIVPLGHDDAARGALLVGCHAPGALSEDARGLMLRLADRAAIALAQTELYMREQAALRQASLERSSLEVIFDSLLDGVFTTDLQGQITRLNRRALAWSEREASEAIGRSAEDVFPLVDSVGRPVDRPNDTDRGTDDLYLRRPHGAPIPVAWVRSDIHDASGQKQGTVWMLRDLRGQREVEQLKANIISLVSHELRTPLSHIKGYASTLLQPDVEWDAETRHDFLVSIERQADRLARLISDLLEISRLDAGGAAQLDRVPIAPATLVERGLAQAAPTTGGHPIDVHVPESLPLVWADPNHIERVVGNLVENAAKYSPEGASISIRVEEQPESVIFAVRDHGPGLTVEEQRHLFERFYRSPRLKHRTPGTGLGLAICKEIVEAHQGTIKAESVEGEGSVFRFALPRMRRSETL